MKAKLTVKGIPIKDVGSWKIDTVTEALNAARERFRLTQTEAAALECEHLYEIQQTFKRWTSKEGDK